MRARRRKVSLGWLLLLFQLAIGLVPAGGLVFCVGQDGHFDLEAPHVGAPCHATASSWSSTDPDCVDVVLESADAVGFVSSAPVVPPPVALAAVAFSGFSAPRMLHWQLAGRAPAAMVLPHRTTILLI
jgi:hypothetical protein